jgi:cell wall-associated NlpC family hydrolase
MGNGTGPIDDGTLARIGSPEPGPIGLDSRGGNAKPNKASMAERIVSYASRNRGERVGDGECYTLVNRALASADAKTAKDFGAISPDADYVWGASVSLTELQPGDVIQFRDYSYERVDVVDDDSGTTTDEHAEDRPHHTAIVQSVDGNGAVTVWEQNAPEGSAVKRTQLFFASRRTTSGSRTTTIKVTGTFWFYRPEAR